MNLNILYQNIGNYNEDLNCLLTLYLVYPEIPLYEIKQDKEYFIPIVNKYFSKVNDLQIGDLIILSFYNGFHFCIYAENNKIFHCCKNHKLRLSDLSKYKKCIVGVYRWLR